MKYVKNRDFYPILEVQNSLAGSTGKIFFPYIRPPPPKIIKNRLNFAPRQKIRFFANFGEITTFSTSLAYGGKKRAVAVKFSSDPIYNRAK